MKMKAARCFFSFILIFFPICIFTGLFRWLLSLSSTDLIDDLFWAFYFEQINR